ncbi:lysine--tRNA ligase [uncultured Enterovirga sp.]|uniref:lysine--tRNA ligase n=1 Tax=uncultured Enterovirga sp. TaxID=2026352 RepID=UPI0035CC39DF
MSTMSPTETGPSEAPSLAEIPSLTEAARSAGAWPFEEARKLVARLERSGKDHVLFETGYGPSGLPHIGTFGEVARTSMVRHAFRVLTEDRIPTRLVAFSDDMDGLRKVPDNVPNQAMMASHLGKPLSRIPDPFSNEHPSFGAANNARLRAFLDRFGFDYEFASASDYYASGRFDPTLLKMLRAYDEVMEIILPTLGPERRATYSPFLPISARTGIVLQVPTEERDVDGGRIAYRDPETDELVWTSVTGGAVKCQWKADWAMRWVALGVDYEMAGKDLIDSVKLSSQITRALGAEPPEGFNYELFLDEEGRKISKSKGNGLTIDEWLRYGTPESLALFMYNRPREAKKLHFDVIPRAVDEYLGFLARFPNQDAKNRLGNAVWHIHAGDPPAPELVGSGAENATTLSFSMLLNLVAVANTEDPAVLWAFIRRYAPNVSPETHPVLDRLVRHAVSYYGEFRRPAKTYRDPNAAEQAALAELEAALAGHEGSTDADGLQAIVYEVGRKHFPDTSGKSKSPDGRTGVSQTWFASIYNVLFGEARGPRFGSFVALYGVAETRALVRKALAGDLVREHGAFLERRAA